MEALSPRGHTLGQRPEQTPPEYVDWYKEGSDSGGTETSDTTAGRYRVLKALQSGRTDPVGLTTKTLYLTVPIWG